MSKYRLKVGANIVIIIINYICMYKFVIVIQRCCNCNPVTSPLEGYNEVVQRREETREDPHSFTNENAH